MNAADVYSGSDGELTKRYYADLILRGKLGQIAMNLFRAQKCSARAKVYRGGLRGQGSYKSLAYERKSWSMSELCRILAECGAFFDIRYGWKEDPATVFGERASCVLYVDLPQGQVSFHSPSRGAGPDYPAEWDQARMSEERILAFCDAVMGLEPSSAEAEPMALVSAPPTPVVIARPLRFGDPESIAQKRRRR